MLTISDDMRSSAMGFLEKDCSIGVEGRLINRSKAERKHILLNLESFII